MLAPGQSPFPNNPVCKRCITKPCHRLFAGRVYAGKMIFVHHSEWKMLPCYDPKLKKPAVDYKEEPALTDDIEVISGNIEISNPRWELIDDDGGGSPGPGITVETPCHGVSTGDTVQLMADVKNYPNGASVTFDIYDTSSNPPFRIATVQGTNKNGIGTAIWTVEDILQAGGIFSPGFEAIVKSKATSRCNLPIAMPIKGYTVTLCIDPQDPSSWDDFVLLKGINSDYEQRKTVNDDKIPGDGMLTVIFDDLVQGNTYRLVHHDGQVLHTIFDEMTYGE